MLILCYAAVLIKLTYYDHNYAHDLGVYYFAEWNGMECPILLNTYFTERLKNKPKQLPTLELLFWINSK